MALSYYYNWESFQQFDTDVAIADPELGALSDAWNYDYLFDPSDLFHSENPNYFLHDFSNGVPYDNINPIATEFDPFHYPKRQKGFDFEQFYSETNQFNPNFFNGFIPNPNYLQLQDYSLSEIAMPQLPEFPIGYTTGSCESIVKKEASGGGTLSVQSIAARQRRRKITEKTQELGKLVPGGQKMNTAEMLQAAYKYIKYLQAQVGVLEFIGSSHQENPQVSPVESSEEFELLLESPLIQEKLYSTENCLVPEKSVEHLRSDHEIFKSMKQEH